RHLADLVAARGDDGHAVDAGSARLDHDVELLLLEVAQMLGRDLADLVVSREPAELEIHGLGLALGKAAGRQQARRGKAGVDGAVQQRATAKLTRSQIAHGYSPFSHPDGANAIDPGCSRKEH